MFLCTENNQETLINYQINNFSTVLVWVSKKYFIHLLMRDTEREAGTEAAGGAGSPWGDVGLNPRTPGSQPEPKADTQPLSHPGARSFFLCLFFNLFLPVLPSEH